MDSQHHDPATVFIIDDEQKMLTSLDRLLRSVGYQTECHASAEDFLKHLPQNQTGCVLLDAQLPGLNGLELQERLVEIHFPLPIIFLSTEIDLPTIVKAIKGGAENFLSKTAGAQELLLAVDETIKSSRDRAPLIARREEMLSRAASLSEREHEICTYVISGQLNKMIGHNLGIVERTVKAHRARVMEKLGVSTVVELVRASELAGIEPVGGES